MNRFIVLTAVLAACGEPGDKVNPVEVISRVPLTFTPASGTAVTFTFDDPDGDGGAPGTSEPITLVAGTTYQLTVGFFNALETPPEDITVEVRDEGVEHQVFFTGTAIGGPLTHAYADTDDNGFPIGLTSTITTTAGTGDLTVTLRHMPPEEPPPKAANSADLVAASGFSAIGGSTDAQVTFVVTVP